MPSELTSNMYKSIELKYLLYYKQQEETINKKETQEESENWNKDQNKVYKKQFVTYYDNINDFGKINQNGI